MSRIRKNDMGIEKFFHMNQGEDALSYAKNSSFQKHVISVVYPEVAEALAEIFHNSLPESMGIADLGCSSGPNSLMVVYSAVNWINALCSEKGIKLPELRVSLNDLITNDFNRVLVTLPEFYEKLETETGITKKNCYVSAVAGSFYGRLFPKKSLHFVHSSFSLHWLSQVPEGLKGKGNADLNKGKVYVSDTSPDCIFEAYLAQFESDFHVFLRSRAEEIVAGGKMVLYFIGRKAPKPTVEGDDKYELLSLALMSMASEGLIEEEKIDSFDVPYYAPSLEEVKNVIETEGSFIPNKVVVFEVKWEEELMNGSKGRTISSIMRAANESMLKTQFGSEVMDELFIRLSNLCDHSQAKSSYVMLVSVTRSEKLIDD